MTTAVDKILLTRLLGEAHALWLPLGTPGAPWWAAIWETRRLYPRHGLPWRGQGDKGQAGALAALLDAGGDRRPDALAPPAAFLTARPLADVPVDHHETRRLFGQIVRRVDGAVG